MDHSSKITDGVKQFFSFYKVFPMILVTVATCSLRLPIFIYSSAYRDSIIKTG